MVFSSHKFSSPKVVKYVVVAIYILPLWRENLYRFKQKTQKNSGFWRLSNAYKCYRIGEKNLITKDNDFELATGNSSGVIGYDHRISQKVSKKLNRNINAMPTTLLATPITQLVSNPEKIMFILQKPIQEKRYQKILYEIKKGLLRENYSLLPQNIQNSICCYNSEF